MCLVYIIICGYWVAERAVILLIVDKCTYERVAYMYLSGHDELMSEVLPVQSTV